MIDIYIVAVATFLVLFYSIVKERQELGCFQVSIERQCNDDESVYVKNTKMEKNDTCYDLLERLKSNLSYHEKGAVWRRSLIIGAISVIATFLVYHINNTFNNIYYYVVLLLLFFTIQYFYHNYLHYHQFRRLKNNGVEILDRLKNHCFAR